MFNMTATALFCCSWTDCQHTVVPSYFNCSKATTQFKDTVCSPADCLQSGKRRSINVRQLAVVPVPVPASEEPVLGAGVGVLPLLKPPGGRTADQRLAKPVFFFCCVSDVPFTANRWSYSTDRPWNYVSAILEI